MRLGVIADDFTGASDIANTLAREGMSTRLFVGPEAVGAGADAGVVALKTRSVPAAEAVAASLAALAALREAGARQIVFKYCSTFDSTRQGNIGPVADALAEALGAHGVVVCPAFPATGRTVYQGHLFVGDRLVSETGMAAHPLTPMTDPDLRRWLGHSTATAPGLVPLATVRAGPGAIRDALAAGPRLSIIDATSDDDLRAIGAAVADAPLVTGASGVALGLPANFRAAGLPAGQVTGFRPNQRVALVLAGSCSVATREQVRTHRTGHPALAIDIERLLAGAPVFDEALAFAEAERGRDPLIWSSADPAAVSATQAAHGGVRVAEAVEALFGEIARAAVARGFGRIVVAGGETSGAVVSALAATAFDLGPEIDPGVPALSAHPGLALALKSGNFGGADLFAKAIRMLSGG